MKKAIVGNRRLIMLAVIVLIIAILITAFPSLQAEAQAKPQGRDGLRFETRCQQRTVYTCVYRRGRRVCGYLTYWVCYNPSWYR